MSMRNELCKKQGLYDPAFEKENCGVGFIANIHGEKENSIIKDGLTILKNLTHRWATGADPETGDGAGILIQMPHDFFKKEFAKEGIDLPNEGEYGIGMFFLPLEPNSRYFCEGVAEEMAEKEGFTVLGWRSVPINEKGCGETARGTMPTIRQLAVEAKGLEIGDFERKLYLVRKQIENIVEESQNLYKEKFYICSFSSKTIVYK